MEILTVIMIVLLPVILTGVMVLMHIALAACELTDKQIAFLCESTEMQDVFFGILWSLTKSPTWRRQMFAMILTEVGALTTLTLVIIGFYFSLALDARVVLVPFCLLVLAIWFNIKNRNIAKLPMKMAFRCCIILKAMGI